MFRNGRPATLPGTAARPQLANQIDPRRAQTQTLPPSATTTPARPPPISSLFALDPAERSYASNNALMSPSDSSDSDEEFVSLTHDPDRSTVVTTSHPRLHQTHHRSQSTGSHRSRRASPSRTRNGLPSESTPLITASLGLPRYGVNQQAQRPNTPQPHPFLSTTSPSPFPLQPQAGPLSSSTRLRLQSLDLLRGITIVGMVIVNYQRFDDGGVYSWLRHADWIGLTLADLVFPSFLFICGVSIPLSLQTRPRDTASILGRSIILFAIGLLLNDPFSSLIQAGNLADFRIMGVLQRTALSYGVVATVYNTFVWHVFAFILPLACLTVHTVLTYAIPQPTDISCPSVFLLSPPGCTAQATVDQIVLGRKHLYNFLEYDPEGILSTFNSIITVWAGGMLGVSLLRTMRFDEPMSASRGGAGRYRHRALKRMLAYAFCITLFGVIIGVPWIPTGTELGRVSIIPISKNLWTPSFTIISGGLVLTLYTVVFWAVEIRASGSRSGGNGRPRSGIGSSISRPPSVRRTTITTSISTSPSLPQLRPASTGSVTTTVTTTTMMAASEDEPTVWSWLVKRLSKITTPSSRPSPIQASASRRGATTTTSVLADIFIGIGRNPLALYLISEILMFTMSRITVHLGDGDEEGVKLDVLLYRYGFASWIAPVFSSGMASLCWSLFWVIFVVFPISFLLHRYKLYWRV
ncbi:hypothetical protein BJ742DRAFT_850020 [Cladochytrium replicatum]|nr:hypothetical protein BJ742DRAFT_850020 [Cladochytrium replicatum]